MTIWFTSDLHLDHENIISFCDRPFSDIYHMSSMLVRDWNNTVLPTDIVYVVGDVCMGTLEHSLSIIDRLCGHIYLVPGNHDRVHKMYEDQSKYSRMLDMYFEVFDDILDEQIFLENFRICHFPYNNPGKPDYQGRTKYSQWEPFDDGMPLICGHVHDTWAEHTTPKGTLMINVGVDVRNYKPVSFEAVKQIAIEKGRSL